MPNTSGSKRKHNESAQKNTSNSSNASTESISRRTRKRKRCEALKSSDSELEAELDGCENAKLTDRRLRKVAKDNALSEEEMHKLLQKVVKNEHVLALVAIQAEDELARERLESEKRALLITHVPSVPKLTRAKARELNKTPSIAIPSLAETPQSDIAALIKDDLNSDEDDEEYTFQEEDYNLSDDEQNTTCSDLDSNPRTPATPLTTVEESPVKLTADGCFKIPLNKIKETEEDLRIATRTRSKLCLQKTTIEDIQSEFVPPDVEQFDMLEGDMAATDEDWMQFLNDFSKPLNSSFVGDDDDPVNDPEYVAAEKIPVDAEELRDINISKKELTELVAELFEGFKNEEISLESIELETPQKFLTTHNESASLVTPTTPASSKNSTQTNNLLTQVTRQIDFSSHIQQQPNYRNERATTSIANSSQTEYSFQPGVMSTPSTNTLSTVESTTTLVPIASFNTQSPFSSPCKTISIPNSMLNTKPELIAVPMQGQPNCYQLAKVISTEDTLIENINPNMIDMVQSVALTKSPSKDTRYSTPYDCNYTWEYISIKRHVYTEYIQKFQKLQRPETLTVSAEHVPEAGTGFTQMQYDMLQQQLRIHVQMLTQSFVQTYCHPDFWKWAPKAKKMVTDLSEKAKEHATFNVWNLPLAVDLMAKWEGELAADTPENKELMKFFHREIELTNRNTRQIPRFHPRIMNLMLDSHVFLYPQYLPRIPFSPKICSYHSFSPAESHLIAIGLEKHLTRMREEDERLPKRVTPLIVACGRLSKDTIYGKTKRRIWDHVKSLKKSKYYNPIKYFFEHDRAPPVESELIRFENNVVVPLRQRFNELPAGWQNFLQKEQEKQNQLQTPPARKKPPSISEQARLSYLNFVREVVGDEDIDLPENLTEPAQPDGRITDASANTSQGTKPKSKKGRQRKKAGVPSGLTINVNYVFGSSSTNYGENTVSSIYEKSITSTTASFCSANSPVTRNSSNNFSHPQENLPAIAYTFDPNTQTLQSAATALSLTAAEELQSQTYLPAPKEKLAKKTHRRESKTNGRKRKICKRPFTYYGVAKSHQHSAAKYRLKSYNKKRCCNLLIRYQLHLQVVLLRFNHVPPVQYYYKHFKALHLYTELLTDLKMLCRNANATNSQSSGAKSSATNSNALGKRTRNPLTQGSDEDGGTTVRSKKANRQEENFRHMLLPDTPEDTNRKDAIYAFNFYEKVEEIFKTSNRPEDYKKFNNILKSFNPNTDKVADLYHKLENLFLPHHPELAEVFLTFLLPAEAAEIGKFFEHFMITNMTTFITKLNVYFNKQPAQIRKIYNCLNELAEDPHVTMKIIESKILPLLKGNQFLIDWFLQQFPQEQPPARLLSAPERINLKDVQDNTSGEFMEIVTDVPVSPTQDQPPACQLRYSNGRIFYGSKIVLPAKLSFMASSFRDARSGENTEAAPRHSRCVHGIREQGEKRLAEAGVIANALNDCNSDENEKSEEDEVSKGLIIDTTCGEEDSSSSFETCDDATLRAHAMRLNPTYYADGSHATHSLNTRKSSANTNEEGKISPRKNAQSALQVSNFAQSKEKRKSPTKKIRSPVCAAKGRVNMQPMVVIHEQNPAIGYAKRLKSLIEEENATQTDSKERMKIVAAVKQTKQAPPTPYEPVEMTNVVTKIENTDDLEFIPEHTDVAPFPQLKVDLDSSEEYAGRYSPQQQSTIDSDEDCKLGIVASLAAGNDSTDMLTPSRTTESTRKAVASSSPNAWTRDEDKAVLIEMKLGSKNHEDLFLRIKSKIPNRSLAEIRSRHQFLMDFLSKLQGN